MLYRMYYKSRIMRTIYSDALQELSDEVYISTFMIQKILLSKSDDLLHIKKEAPSVKFLKDKYPHIVW